MTLDQELTQIADKAARLLASVRSPTLQAVLEALERESRNVGRSWSGSNIGYHATIYFVDLMPPPTGTHFSAEWGLEDRWPVNQVHPGWREHDHKWVMEEILRRAGGPALATSERDGKPVRDAFFELKEAAASNMLAALRANPDTYLQDKLDQLQKLEAPDIRALVKRWLPGSHTSRDSLAMHQGLRAAPHQGILAIPLAVRELEVALTRVGAISRESAAHMKRITGITTGRTKSATGPSVFIGHGRSLVWRELADFVERRLTLNVEEFNRVSVAGKSTQERLSELLDNASFAFLIMT